LPLTNGSEVEDSRFLGARRNKRNHRWHSEVDWRRVRRARCDCATRLNRCPKIRRRGSG